VVAVPEVSTATEEAGEEVEWIVTVSSTTTLLVVLQSVMSVLIVYAP
jgi:hypothetical protein